MIQKYAVSVCALLICAASCAKIPEKVQSPSLKIDIETRDGAEVYSVRFSGGIANENSSTALGDVKGSVIIRDPESKKGVFSIPYRIDMILPFSMGIIDAGKTCSKTEVEPLIGLFNINAEEMARNKGSEGIFVEEDRISLAVNSYLKHDINTLLQGKINEKNK